MANTDEANTRPLNPPTPVEDRKAPNRSERMPEIKATNLNRQDVNHGHARLTGLVWLPDYQTWCPSCRAVMPRYRQLIEDAGIPEDARIELELGAARFQNMVGGRFSDAVAAEIANYQRLGHDAYIAEMVRSRKAIREMGY